MGENKVMNFRNLNENDLAAFAENMVTLLGGTELDAIDSHVRADLVTAFGSLPATLRTKADAAAVSKDVGKAAVSDRNDVRFQIEQVIAQVRDSLKASLASKGQYDLAGLDFPAKRVAKYVAQDPTELSGSGTSNGVNRLIFSGNNKPGQVTYEVWRRQGDEGQWAFLTSTTKQFVEDKPVTPGQYYEYKVRAVAANTTSNYSNSAVVYGAL
jgi:hypothetical protein